MNAIQKKIWKEIDRIVDENELDGEIHKQGLLYVKMSPRMFPNEKPEIVKKYFRAVWKSLDKFYGEDGWWPNWGWQKRWLVKQTKLKLIARKIK